MKYVRFCVSDGNIFNDYEVVESLNDDVSDMDIGLTFSDIISSYIEDYGIEGEDKEAIYTYSSWEYISQEIFEEY